MSKTKWIRTLVLLAAVVGLIISFPALERLADAKDTSNSGNKLQSRSSWWQQLSGQNGGCGDSNNDDGGCGDSNNDDGGDDGDNGDNGDNGDGDDESGNRWQPDVSDTWQWQLDGAVNTTYAVDVYDIDLFDSSEELISELHESGHKVVCYFSAGSFEEWRPDKEDFNQEDLGNNMDGWEGEIWLDIRSANVREIMQARLDLAKQKGCDGVEPDNISGYSNDSGFALTAEDQLEYNRFLAQEAHSRNLAIALKNDIEQAADLVNDFDFTVNEQCHEYNECDSLAAFIEAGKPVFNAEYAYDYNDSNAMQALCTDAINRNFHTLVLPLDLDDSFRYSCDDAGEEEPPTDSCGNGVCDEGESAESCPGDCEEEEPPTDSCGNGVCDEDESVESCPSDCEEEEPPTDSCGNGVCDEGESVESCPSDCEEEEPPTDSCGNSVCDEGETPATCPADCEEEEPPAADTDANILFLHHSTGGNLYSQGGVSAWFANYNNENNTDYEISERAYPDSPYPWANYPYDYWNLWINGACDSNNPNIECLDTLAQDYDVVIFKHCFPGADIQTDTGSPDISSSTKTLENYKLQYQALRDLMDSYPGTDFIVWTLAPLHRLATSPDNAARAKEFVDWVKNDWLSEGGAHANIHVFDFWGHAAEDDPNPENGGEINTLKYDYEQSHTDSDSHPNRLANETIGPEFADFIVKTIQSSE